MGTERDQQFCLRWHNYQNCLLATLPQLLDGDDLTDVTLCAGGRNIRAHKVVLSACSQYFMDLFKEMVPMQHPVIVLPGTYFTDLCALVTFMYSGEVNVYEHQLTGLLSIAETLQIRGLAEFSWSGKVNNNNNNNNNNNDIVKKETLSSSSRNKRSKPTERPSLVKVEDHLSVSPPIPPGTATGQKARGLPWPEPVDQSIAEDLSQRPTLDPGIHMETSESPPADTSPVPLLPPSDLTQVVTETKPRNGNPKMYATCFVCGKQLSNQYNLRVHMETHQNAHYACSACNHVSRSRDALRKHISYRHPQPQAVHTVAAAPRASPAP